MEWLPWVSKDVANVAFPLTSAAEPNVAVPSFNVTVPPGVPLPGATAATVTLNVTVVPNVDGFGEEVSVVKVAALLTVCVRTADVLGLKAVPPLYVAVME